MKNRAIQGLRGLFALGVLVSHCYFLADYEQSRALFSAVLQKLANVSFFFVVAGYFLAKSSSVNLKVWDFLKKKMSRIYPLHILVILALVGLAIITNTFKFDIALPLNALLVQTWIPNLKIATSFNTVSWFLSSLMFCYIAGYWVVKLNNKLKNFHKYIYASTAVLLLFKVVVALVFPTNDTGYYWCYLFPLAGFVDFMVGVSIALALKGKKLPKATAIQIFSLVLLVVVFACKRYLPINYCRAFVSLPVNVLLVVSFLSETKFSNWLLGNKLMCFLGDLSFEVYLLHPLVIRLIGNRSFVHRISENISPFVTLAIIICMSAATALIYKVIFNFTMQRIKSWRLKNEKAD